MTPDVDVVDQFCGVGWGFALEELGMSEHGIDIEPTVAATRERLGWSTTCGDILDLNPHNWDGVDGLISSPPCQSWSTAGKGAGLDDPRGQLVWQPLVWALAIRPRWIACEQVPPARGAFERVAHRLREVGYHATVYEVSSETLGVPQTRRRVFLVAHRDFPPPRLPLTHQRYRKGVARAEPCDMLGHLPWVSMIEALGVGFTERPGLTVRGASPSGGGRGMDGGAGARETIAEAIREGKWQMTNQNSEMGEGRVERYGRPVDSPSPTVTGNGRLYEFTDPPADRLRMSGQRNATDRSVDEPSGVVLTRSVNGKWANGAKLTEAQGCRLMAFPDHAVDALAGNQDDRWRIIGNAVPPPVARAVLRTITKKDLT